MAGRATTPRHTARWQRRFLTALEDFPSVERAARAAGVGRATVYRHREADPAFRDAWENALGAGLDDLEGEAFRRAKAGSDALLMFLLKAWRPNTFNPSRRIRTDLRTQKKGGSLLLTAEEWATLDALLLQATPDQTAQP